MAPPVSKSHIELPDHLLHHVIMPKLPFKVLNRFKCISKEMYSLITEDARFAADQACASSSGFIYMTKNGLSFFPDTAVIGVPDPSLKFLKPTSSKVDLISSVNGLLLLYGSFDGIGIRSLCVCNPATKEMSFVPNADKKTHYRLKKAQMGLAFDPRKAPDRYTIVNPVLHQKGGRNCYKFDVFRSETGEWTRSSRKIYVGPNSALVKPLYAEGVIFWCYGGFATHLVWYDTYKDVAGWTELPVFGGSTYVGVYADAIIYCRAWRGGIEVWRRTSGSHWDKLYATSWDGMIAIFGYCHQMRLRRTNQSETFYSRRDIRTAGFDGRFVYITSRLGSRTATEKLFSWDTVTGRVEDKGLITINMDWGLWDLDQVFSYANSMAKVPQILHGAA